MFLTSKIGRSRMVGIVRSCQQKWGINQKNAISVINYSKSTSIDTIGSSLVPLRRIKMVGLDGVFSPKSAAFRSWCLRCLLMGRPRQKLPVCNGRLGDGFCLFFMRILHRFFRLSFPWKQWWLHIKWLMSYLRSASNMPYLRRSNWSSRDSCVSFAKWKNTPTRQF
jgi:hypothetical protein